MDRPRSALVTAGVASKTKMKLLFKREKRGEFWISAIWSVLVIGMMILERSIARDINIGGEETSEVSLGKVLIIAIATICGIFYLAKKVTLKKKKKEMSKEAVIEVARDEGMGFYIVNYLLLVVLSAAWLLGMTDTNYGEAVTLSKVIAIVMIIFSVFGVYRLVLIILGMLTRDGMTN